MECERLCALDWPAIPGMLEEPPALQAAIASAATSDTSSLADPFTKNSFVS